MQHAALCQPGGGSHRIDGQAARAPLAQTALAASRMILGLSASRLRLAVMVNPKYRLDGQ